MPTTPNYALPYPSLADPPDGPDQIGDLAIAADLAIKGVQNGVDSINAALIAMLLNDAAYQEVLTAQTTTSLTYANLATVGPTVTLTSQGTRAFVVFGMQSDNSTPANGAAASVAISGATTLAASDDRAVGHNVGNTGFGFYACNFYVATINPGSNTYTMQYRVGGTTGTFGRRRLWVFAP